MSCSNFLRIKSSPSGATILRIPTFTLGGDKLRIRDTIYELTPEIYEALPFKGYTGRTKKNENDNLMMNNFLRDLGNAGIGDRSTNWKTFFTETLPNLVEEIQNKTFDEFELEGQGIQKTIIPSNIIDIYTRWEVLLGLSGHTYTLSVQKLVT